MTAPKVVVADPAKRQDIRVITAPMPYPVSYPNSIFEGPTPHASTPTSPILRPTQGHLSSSSSSSTLVNLAQLQITKDQDKKEPEIFSREPGSPDSSFGRGDDPEKRGSSPPPPTEPPYHVFSRGRKRQMVYIVSLAALFSPLSSNIYFPALGDVSQQLNISMSLASLTITVYMIVQGIAPSFWGSLADALGRRVIFIGTFIVYLVANIALGFSNTYAEVMIFRALQAAGSAATISIGAGVIGDITTSAERGGLVGAFGGIRMFGQSIGPVFGGLLTQYCGYLSIFWFLTAFGGFSLITIIFFLPETLRSIGGDGTVRLVGYLHKPIIYFIAGQPHVNDASRPDGQRVGVKLLTIFEPLIFLAEKDVFITLFFGSIVYTVWSMVTSSTTALFQDVYHLNALQIGLTFLANGAGCMCGSFTMGYIMDRDHRRTEVEYCQQRGWPSETRITTKSHEDFHIELARLRNNWWIVLIFVAATTAYGFSLSTHLAVPIILQYLIAFTATAVFSVNSALIIDLYPGKSASATAVNNLMRCSVGAGGVAIVQPMINALTARWTFLLLAGITAIASPLLFIELKYGAVWRTARNARRKTTQSA